MSNDSSKTAAVRVAPRALFNWDIADGLVLWLIAFRGPQYFVSELAQYSTAILPQAQNIHNAILYVLIEGFTIGLLAVFMRLYGLRLRDLGLNKMKLKFLPDIAIGYFAYLALTYVFATIAQYLNVDLSQKQELGFSEQNSYELVITFVLLVIVVPMAEELLFRGFLFRIFRKWANFVWTAVLVSVLFGLVHGTAGVGLDVFALSLVLCYLRETTASLWPGIMLHGLKNAVAFFVVFIYNGH